MKKPETYSDLYVANTQLVLENVQKFYESIPANSKIRSSIITSLFANCSTEFISDFVTVDQTSVLKV